MGFAQKLGEFTEGFAGGLLPGLQAGSRIAGQRQTRALAQKRENRLATAAERSVITDMFSRDPMGAITLAESKGFTNLASSLRRKTSGNVKTEALTALQGAPIADMPPIIDYSPKGLREAVGETRNLQATTQQSIAGIDTALGSVPVGFEKTPELEALSGRRNLLREQEQRLGQRVTGLNLVLAQLTSMDYLSPNYTDSINGVINSYIEATGNPEGAEALRTGLNKAARDARYETWSKVIGGLKGDEEGLENLLAEPAITEDPRLFELVSYLHSSAKRTAGMSPREREIQTKANAEAQFLWGQAENTTDPSAAEALYEQALEAYEQAGMSKESIDSMREQIPKLVQDIGSRTRDRFAENIIKTVAQGVANWKDPIVTLREIGSVYGITVPEGIKLASPEGQSIVKSISDAAYEIVRGVTTEEKQGTEEEEIISILLSGDLSRASNIWNKYTTQPGIIPSMYEAELQRIRSAGFDWFLNPVPFIGGEFRKIEQRGAAPTTSPQNPMQQEAATSQDTSATASFLGTGGAPR